MSDHESPDPAVAEADRRVERAKASLLSRVEVLKHRFGDVKHAVDLHAHIARHPLPAIGIAFGLGALAALGGARRAAPRQPGEHSLTGVGVSALAAFALRIVRELAIAQLGNAAKQWWTEQAHEIGGTHTPGTPDLEPFLEH